MRVLHVGLETTSARSGGLNRYVEELVAAERNAGLDARAVVLGDAVAAPRGTVVAAPPGGSMARAARAIDRAVRGLGHPDVADLHFAGTAAITATIGALRQVPRVVHFQGPWADESAYAGAGGLNVAAKRAIERRVYRRADRCIVLTSRFGEILRDLYGVAPWAIEVVAPGVDLVRFAPGDRDAARAVVGVGLGRIVLAVRRLVPRMGHEVLLEAWRSMDRRPDDLLAIVGDGPSARQLHALTVTLGLSSSVRFCDRVDDDELVAWYRAADVTVVPSVALEGFGLVVLESLACGTPVIGTDAGGLREAIELLGQGPAVPAGDVAALAVAIDRALAVSDAPSRRAACRMLAEPHGWPAVAARHEELYADVLGGDARPHVVVLDHTAALSGGELAIARAISGIGTGAVVHTILGEDGPLRARLEATGSTVEVLALAPSVQSMQRGRVGRVSARQLWATTRYVLALGRRLRELRPDVVHTNSLKSALYGGWAAKLARVPCVWHVRDRLEPPALPAAASRMMRTAARVLPTLVVANSDSTRATIGLGGVRVVPSPLDPSITARHEPLEVDGPTRFAIVGRLAPWKGQRLAIEAFADAFPDSSEVLAVAGAPLFGEDDYAAGLATLVHALGVSDRVSLCGFVDDVASLLASTDVLIHASLDPEPFGQVVIEALGAGCAVLAADAGGPREILTDGVDGVLYPMGDRAALARALRRLAADPTLRRRLADAGVATAAAYTPQALAPLLLEAWDEARARGPHRWIGRSPRA